MPQTRQLAAIMFTDIVGYTALMGEDEEKAFEVLNKNKSIQKQIIEDYRGTLIKELGDGILASFTTVSDSVQAAIKIQETCNQINEFQLRIGIHHGEIVFQENDVFGDAVNIASRVQAIAPVGGIWISESVHQNVVNKKNISTRYVKTEKLKNVKEMLRIYEVVMRSDHIFQPKTNHQKNITETVRKTSFRPLSFLLIAVLIIFGLLFFISKGKGVLATASIQSIAVLPFVNESRVADMEYLSDGMTETLINSLSKLGDLSVKARSSVFRYKGKNIEPQKAGTELSVVAILNGRVAQRGDNIILNLELVDVKTGNQIWGEQYNRKSTDLVALQSEIARDVANKLQQKLTGAGGQKIGKNYTANSEAYKLYLRGLFHWHKRTENDLKKAIDYFNQAKEKDPSFALAYAGLAVTYNVLSSNIVMTRQNAAETRVKANAAALKALELDESLAEPHAVLASQRTFEWDFNAAVNEYKRAIELNPNFASAHQWYSELLSRLGKQAEAMVEVKKAYELDPFSPAVNMNVGLRYYEAKRFDEAIAQFRKTIELAPDYPMPYWFLSDLYFRKGLYEESLELSAKAQILMKMETPESAESEITELRQAIKQEGKKGYWRKILEEELKGYRKGYNSAVYVAIAYWELGDKEKVFEWLEKAYTEHDEQLTYLKNNVAFDNLRSDSRFKDLLKRVGLPE